MNPNYGLKPIDIMVTQYVYGEKPDILTIGSEDKNVPPGERDFTASKIE